MQNNPEIEFIVDQAVKIAREKSHEYVITEHLLLSLLRHQPFRKLLDRFGVEVTQMDQEVNAYLDGLKNLQDMHLINLIVFHMLYVHIGVRTKKRTTR